MPTTLREKCLFIEHFSGTYAQPIYDCGHVPRDFPVFYVNQEGAVEEVDREVDPYRVLVPWLYPGILSSQAWDECLALMLTRRLMYKSVPRGELKVTATFDLKRLDLDLGHILTHEDHWLIPEGYAIAIPSGDFLGRVTIDQDRRGMCLYNRQGVIGYNLYNPNTELKDRFEREDPL